MVFFFSDDTSTNNSKEQLLKTLRVADFHSFFPVFYSFISWFLYHFSNKKKKPGHDELPKMWSVPNFRRFLLSTASAKTLF